MNLETQQVSRPELSDLLASAEQRRRCAAAATDLTECLLAEIHSALSARCVRLWAIAADEPPQLICQTGHSDEQGDRYVKSALPGLVRRVRNENAPDTVSESVWVTSCEIGDGLQSVLELHLISETDDELMQELSEVFADLHRRKLVASYVSQSRRERTLQQIVALLHLDLDAVRVANCLASDASEFLNCRRISVARRRSGNRWEVVAATAVSAPDPRSDAARWLCSQIEAACRDSADFTSGDDQSQVRPAAAVLPDVRPKTKTALTGSDVLTEPGGHVVVRPLTRSNQWTDAEWAAVFEMRPGSSAASDEQALVQICRHASLSLKNCGDRSHAAWMPALLRVPRGMRRQRVIISAAALFVVAALMFWKTELYIEANGRLVPTERAFIFAPEEGVITDVLVEDGSIVSPGSVMCRMRNEDLEIQLEALEGELASTSARLAAIESLRGDRSLGQNGLLSAEQAELKEKQTSFTAQAAILKKRIGRLSLESRISGQVFGDRLQETLRGRPVQRGQYLFEVADPASGWELDLRIPEADVRQVLDARAQAESQLDISYALETTPETTLKTSLSELSSGTDVDEFGRLSTAATAVPEILSLQNARPGAGVIAQIHCGERSLGYVLFRRIIESIERRWWL